MQVAQEQPLFVPETGVFALSLHTPGEPKEWDIGFAMPVHPRIVAVLAPKAAEPTLRDILARQLLTDLSLGFRERDSRFVVPPQFVDRQGVQEILGKMQESRHQNRGLFQKIVQYHELLKRVTAEVLPQ